MKIAIGCDHVGYPLKQHMVSRLQEKGHAVLDCGTYSGERCDYPIYGYRTAVKVADGEADLGILVCGTGAGISLSANKVPGIRAVVCSEAYTAALSRAHNDANVLAFGARVVGEAVAEQMVDAFLETQYEGGRHQKRIEMISAIERGEFECTGWE